MIPKLTDDAVSRLPLDGARAALLEEIVGAEAAPAAPRSRRWVAPLAAAALVAGIAGSSLWWGGGDPSPAPAPAPDAAAAPKEPGRYAVLDAPGWKVVYTEIGDDYGSASYENGDQTFEITTYPASTYAGYVEDREHIVDPPAPGEPVVVMGVPGQLWAYSKDDHTVIREVEAGHWMELRGSGMGARAYVQLLDQLRQTSLQEFEVSLPEEFVTADERPETALQMLSGIIDASGAEWPDGRESAGLDLTQQDPYQLGVEVAGAYACAWLAAYDDPALRDEAVRVLDTSRDWPVLQEMAAEGDWPEVVWEYADDVAAGRAPEGYRGGLGCSSP